MLPSNGHQESLFEPKELNRLPEGVGYRGAVACSAAGISYRQLDYWARTGLIEPTVRPAQGSGTQRLYSFTDVLVLGVSLQNIRTAVELLRNRGTEDLSNLTLISDGASVYECTSDDEVIDLVRGGQGVFGIAVGSVWREVEGSLAQFPAETPEGNIVMTDKVIDDLASRRAARNAIA